MTMQPSVLIIEDRPEMAVALRALLRKESIASDYVPNVQKALEKLHVHNYDVLVIDRMLPDGDGLEILQAVKEAGAPSRAMVLSDKGDAEYRVDGLTHGADDYLAKPYHPEEFVLRVKALLRRSRIREDNCSLIGSCIVDHEHQTVQFGETVVNLTKLEYKLLRLFMDSPMLVLAKAHIMESLWSPEHMPVVATVDTVVRRLRKKLTGSCLSILTKYNNGYELVVAG